MPIIARKKVKTLENQPLPAGVCDGSIALSQTLITAGMQCDRQLLYMLNRWEKPGTGLNTFFGTVVHEMLDIFSGASEDQIENCLDDAISEFIQKERGKGTLEWLSPSEQAYQEAIISATLHEYWNYYGAELQDDVVMCETLFNTVYNGVTLTGKIDKVIRTKNGLLLRDHKTAGEISEDEKLLALPLNFQLKFYAVAMELLGYGLPYAYEHNMIRRPKHKRLYNETLPTFIKRLRGEMQRTPGHFFMRFQAKLEDGDLEDFKKELATKLDSIKQLCSGARRALHNEAFCVGTYKCPFLEACSKNSLESYVQRKYISPELR